MSGPFDPGETFVHLRADGGAEPIALTPDFWRASTAAGRYDRVLGAVDFARDEDLHPSMQERHPEADELIYVVAGAIDVWIETDAAGGEGRPAREVHVRLEAGQAALVPRGAWHRLAMRSPGRLLFVNSRSGMEGRPADPAARRRGEAR